MFEVKSRTINWGVEVVQLAGRFMYLEGEKLLVRKAVMQVTRCMLAVSLLPRVTKHIGEPAVLTYLVVTVVIETATVAK